MPDYWKYRESSMEIDKSIQSRTWRTDCWLVSLSDVQLVLIQEPKTSEVRQPQEHHHLRQKAMVYDSVQIQSNRPVLHSFDIPSHSGLS